MSGGYRHLTFDEFFYCYKPQQIMASKGFFNFVCHKTSLRLVSDMTDSNHEWKGKYFFVQGSNWEEEVFRVEKAIATRAKMGESSSLSMKGPFTPTPIALLVRDKQYVMEISQCIIKDANLDECSKHETESLGDSDLFDLTRIRCTAQEALVRQLGTRMATDSEDLKKFKDALLLLIGEVNNQKAQLEGSPRWVKELTKANNNLTTELVALREQVGKAKADAAVEYKYFQPYFDELGVQYGEGFEDFCKLAIASFPSLEFSQIQIDTIVSMTTRGGNVIVEVDDDEADGQVKVEKASVMNEEANRKTTVVDLLVFDAPPA
nr:hypothetical protein CFP56_06998 [Quercus suber]